MTCSTLHSPPQGGQPDKRLAHADAGRDGPGKGGVYCGGHTA
jgi:hypothetical protein